MPEYYRLFADTKQQYQALFRQAQADLMASLAAGRQSFACAECDDCNSVASKTSGKLDGREEKAFGKVELSDVPTLVQLTTAPADPAFELGWLSPLHAGCGYRDWQAMALRWLEQEVGREIWGTLQRVSGLRDAIGCHMCGMCCRMASSEYSYPELLERAKAGDTFASQFTSIFIPYESTDAARRKAPGVVEAVLAESGQMESRLAESGRRDSGQAESGQAKSGRGVHFYHCPYIGEDNRCTIYGSPKRPAICGSYPETPLAFVYEQCAWRGWKDDNHPDTMRAHALLAICEDWTARLKASLETGSESST